MRHDVRAGDSRTASPATRRLGPSAGPGPALPPSPAPSWGQPGDAPPSQEPPPDLAGVWSRVGARLLDALLVGFVLGLLGAAVPLPDGAAYTLLLLVALVLYETLLLASGGRTLGKMVFGLRVVRVDRAPLATPRDALIRSGVIDAIGLVPLGWAIAAIVLEKRRLRQAGTIGRPARSW